jgi:hypothetical protein
VVVVVVAAVYPLLQQECLPDHEVKFVGKWRLGV